MYLGIDLGTSGIKLFLIDEKQQVIASHTEPLAVARLHPGWSEQDPANWIKALEQGFDALRQQAGRALAAVTGMGLSGQMHGATLIDASGTVLRPCILWNDTRSHVEAAQLDADPRFRNITGNIVFPGFTAPKILWLHQHEPAIHARIDKVLLPKDYLRFWLTGEAVSEMSDASGTAWLDVGARDWSAPLLAATELELRHMPRLVEGSAISGVLKPELAQRWGFENNVVVAGGAGDNAATACGMGTMSPGQAFVSLGTSGVLFAANGRYLPNPSTAIHAFCHAVPDRWHQMGVILAAADALNWYAAITGCTPAALTAELGDQLHEPSGVTFLPYLSGERTPYNDASIRGAFVGLGRESERTALTRAVLEGVGFAFKDSFSALADAGTTIDRLMAVGGGAQSHYWLKVIATALGVAIDLPADGDFGAAFGAARLGLIAAENADPLRICTPPLVATTIEPDLTMRDAFEAAYIDYRTLYPLLKQRH